MKRRVVAVLDTAWRRVPALVADNPSLWVFYVVLGAWTILGLFTLFVGILGLLFQGLLLLLLLPAALLASAGVVRTHTRAARIQTGAAFVIALAVVPSCPNAAGPYIFFAVNGRELDALGRELADARCNLWIGAKSRGPDPYNVPDDAVDPLRRRLRRTGARSVGVGGGHVVFAVDGFVDNVSGFAYLPPGTPLPKPGGGFHYGTLGQFVPMATPGWYFFTTF